MSPAQILEQLQNFLQGLNSELGPAGEVITTVFQDLLDLDPLGFRAQPGRYYAAEQCYLVFIHAALFRKSLHAAVKMLTAAGLVVPDAEPLLDHLRRISLSDLAARADQLYHHQWTHLAPEVRAYLSQHLVISLDTVLHPYYGNRKKAQVIGGRKKASSRYHHSYGTIQLLWEGHGLTTGVRLLKSNHARVRWVHDLFDTLNAYGPPTIVLGDGDFWVNELLWNWARQRTGFIIRLGGGVKHAYEVQWLEQRAQATNTLQETQYEMFLNQPSRRLTVRLIAWPDADAEIQSIGVPAFLSALPADFLVQLSRSRFGIETGYRTWNDFRPRTSSRHPSIRYALVLMAVCLYNAYSLARTTPQLVEAPISRHWKRLLTFLRVQPPKSTSKSPSPPSQLPPKGPCRVGPLSVTFRRSYHFLPISLIHMTWSLLISALRFAYQNFFPVPRTREPNPS